MKKLVVIATILFASISSTGMVRAESVSCSSQQYGGVVCGASTSTVTVEHLAVETGEGDNQMIKTLGSIAMAALVATALYKLTYKSYILG